jgi:hypothetical protein
LREERDGSLDPARSPFGWLAMANVRSAAASDAGKSHWNDFTAAACRAPIRSPLQPTVPVVKPAPQVCEGGPAMWIVFYIATIASLSALGLAPNFVPETKDDDSDI